MILHRVLFLVLVGSVAAWAEPQRTRQTPFSMGMRFLGNIRDGMTKTFQDIFGGGPRRNKEATSALPVKQPQLSSGVKPSSPTGTPFRSIPSTVAPLKAAPPRAAPPTAPPQSSFFTVVHESDVTTAFPDIQGFTDESFKPSSFLRDTTPFQGTVDEDQLPFFSPHSGGHSNPQPFVHNHIASPHQNFPSRSLSSTDFTTFGTVSPADVIRDNSIPFGNTATFNMGNIFKRTSSQSDPQSGRHSPEGGEILELAPQPVEIQRLASLPATQSPIYHADVYTDPQSFSGSQESPDHTPVSHIPPQDTTVSNLHPTILLKSHSSIPTHIPLQHFTESQRISTTHKRRAATPEDRATTIEHRITTPQRRPTTPVDLRLVTRQASQPTKEQQQASKKQASPLKIGAGHINAGTKMQVSPRESEDGTQAIEVSGYEFGYGVLDTDTGNQFFHAEKREEGQTRGSYKIQLPDGRVQTVTYVANSNGFHPKITYDGKARYPDVAATATAA
ncbi:uncharacterized protein [Panulirus ornatus]|uniref:uncharacterized protein n=1 Tax=Panulirus ornatus TaxID=150431 RepID=UPI003A895274